jgi:CheY-like chemotaxis protein
MEAVGQVTGGIAHDFDNLLLVITGNIELLEGQPDPEAQKALLKEVKEAAMLGSKLTGQLLTFSRRRHMDARTIQLNDHVVGITDMLRRALGEHVALSTSLSPEAGSIRADAGQLQSAIVNMAVNARDAMPQGGRLVIETRDIVLDADHADFHLELEAGQYVQLSISDTGSGMSPEVRDRLFEPFFTTKETGRGSGLGLAMVYGFVKQCGGHVSIYSELGHGTTFNLYFPSAQVPPTQITAEIRADTDAPVGQTILVVEDDERVRRLTVARLKLIGYQILEASDGPKAIDMLSEGHPVDLVFTDLIMPGGMSGRDVAARARQLQPGVKLLLTSGYAEELVHGEDLERERLKVLRKPYRQADLIAALRDFLATGHSG